MTKNVYIYIDEYNRVMKNIDYLKEKLDVLEKQRKDLLISIKDNNQIKTYYYFRSIIDGIYNLLKEYGWKYSSELFCFLRDKYNIRCCFEYGFEEYYDDTYPLTPWGSVEYEPAHWSQIGVTDEYSKAVQRGWTE